MSQWKSAYNKVQSQVQQTNSLNPQQPPQYGFSSQQNPNSFTTNNQNKFGTQNNNTQQPYYQQQHQQQIGFNNSNNNQYSQQNKTPNNRFNSLAPQTQKQEEIPNIFINSAPLSNYQQNFGQQSTFNQQSVQQQNVVYSTANKTNIKSEHIDENNLNQKIDQAQQDYDAWMNGKAGLDVNFFLKVFM